MKVKAKFKFIIYINWDQTRLIFKIIDRYFLSLPSTVGVRYTQVKLQFHLCYKTFVFFYKYTIYLKNYMKALFQVTYM